MTSSKDDTNNMDQETIGRSNFKYSGTRTELLGASEYTLVTVAVDVTGSTDGFEAQLRKCLVTAVDSCKKSPRSDNLLLRVILFSTSLPHGIEEIHGFKPLAEIDTAAYPKLDPGGETNLYDATYSAVGATNSYAKKLHDDCFMTNAINFIITDGADNRSTMTPKQIAKEVARATKEEFIESVITVLIGINTSYYRSRLENFQAEAELDQFIDAGDVTEGKLAKLAEFVSRSVSSQSQAMGSGGPSQNIDPTI